MTLEIPENETVTYTQYPDYMQAVVESCANCFHLTQTKLEVKGETLNGNYYCTNLDTKHFIEGGMVDKPLLKPAEWKCPLWKEKAEG